MTFLYKNKFEKTSEDNHIYSVIFIWLLFGSSPDESSKKLKLSSNLETQVSRSMAWNLRVRLKQVLESQRQNSHIRSYGKVSFGLHCLFLSQHSIAEWTHLIYSFSCREKREPKVDIQPIYCCKDVSRVAQSGLHEDHLGNLRSWQLGKDKRWAKRQDLQ